VRQPHQQDHFYALTDYNQKLFTGNFMIEAELMQERYKEDSAESCCCEGGNRIIFML
jgi:hypothetical protein